MPIINGVPYPESPPVRPDYWGRNNEMDPTLIDPEPQPMDYIHETVVGPKTPADRVEAYLDRVNERLHTPLTAKEIGGLAASVCVAVATNFVWDNYIRLHPELYTDEGDTVRNIMYVNFAAFATSIYYTGKLGMILISTSMDKLMDWAHGPLDEEQEG